MLLLFCGWMYCESASVAMSTLFSFPIAFANTDMKLCVCVCGCVWRDGGTYERQLAGRVVPQRRRKPCLCLYLNSLVPYNSAIRWSHRWSVACELIISQGRLFTSLYPLHTNPATTSSHMRPINVSLLSITESYAVLFAVVFQMTLHNDD